MHSENRTDYQESKSAKEEDAKEITFLYTQVLIGEFSKEI